MHAVIVVDHAFTVDIIEITGDIIRFALDKQTAVLFIFLPAAERCLYDHVADHSVSIDIGRNQTRHFRFKRIRNIDAADHIRMCQIVFGTICDRTRHDIECRVPEQCGNLFLFCIMDKYIREIHGAHAACHFTGMNMADGKICRFLIRITGFRVADGQQPHLSVFSGFAD